MLLSRKNPPAVPSVFGATLPTLSDAAHTIAALKAGKHVICEKPMATSSADCQLMIDAARQARRCLAIDYRLHFEPHHVEMMRLASEKVYGNIRKIATEFSWRRQNAKPWLLDKTLAGGGAMFDTGVYSIQAGVTSPTRFRPWSPRFPPPSIPNIRPGLKKRCM